MGGARGLWSISWYPSPLSDVLRWMPDAAPWPVPLVPSVAQSGLATIMEDSSAGKDSCSL